MSSTAAGIWVAGGSNLVVSSNESGRIEVNAGTEGIRSYNADLSVSAGKELAVNATGAGSVNGAAGKNNSSLVAQAQTVNITAKAQANKGSAAVAGVSFFGNTLTIDADEAINIGAEIYGTGITELNSSYAVGILNIQSNSHDGDSLSIGSQATKLVNVSASTGDTGASSYGIWGERDKTAVQGQSIAVGSSSTGQAVGILNQWSQINVGSDGGVVDVAAVGNTAFGILHLIDGSYSTAQAETIISSNTITIRASGQESARGADIDGHQFLDTMSQKLVLGGETSKVVVSAVATAEDGEAAGLLTLYRGTSIEVNGSSLLVEAKAEKGTAIGIGAMIGTVEETSSESKIVINAANTTIRAEGLESTAILATSQGQIAINGGLDAQAQNAIMLRGNARVAVNEAGAEDKVVKLTGDINYETVENSTSAGEVILNLCNNESYWTGSVVRTYSVNFH